MYTYYLREGHIQYCMDIETAYMTGNTTQLQTHVMTYARLPIKQLESMLDDTLKGGIVSSALFQKTKSPFYLTQVTYGGLAAHYDVPNRVQFEKQQMHYALFTGRQSCMFTQQSGHGLRAVSWSLEDSEWHEMRCMRTVKDQSGQRNGMAGDHLNIVHGAMIRAADLLRTMIVCTMQRCGIMRIVCQCFMIIVRGTHSVPGTVFSWRNVQMRRSNKARVKPPR